MQGTLIWPLGQEDTLRRKWWPTSIFLPEEFHGQRNLVGYRPWGHKESAMIEYTHTALQIFQHIASKEYNHLVHLFKEAMSFHGVKLKKKKFLLHDSAHFEETKSDWKFHFENLYIIEKQIIPLSVLCNRWTGHLANEIFFFSKKFIDWMELAKIYICSVC